MAKQADYSDKYQQIYNNSSLIKFIIHAKSGDIDDVNEATCKYYGYSKEVMLGMNIEDISLLTKEEVVKNVLDNTISKTKFGHCKHRLANGEIRNVKLYGNFLKREHDNLLSIIVQDLEQVSVFGEEYVKSKAYFDSLFNNSPEAIAIVDKNFKILNINGKFEEIFQYKFYEIENDDLTEVLCDPKLKERSFALRESVMQGKFFSKELKRQKKDGTPIDVLLMSFPLVINGEISEAYCIYSDITEIKKQERQIENLTYKDALTGLYNKEFFSKNLKNLIGQKNKNHDLSNKLSILMVSIAEFKEINDVLGHKISDLMFQSFSARLQESISSEYQLARVSEEGLAIVMPEISGEKEIQDLTQTIIQRLDESFNIESNDFQVSVNIGISVYPDDGLDSISLIRKAEIALERSKLSSKNTAVLFESAYDKEVQEYFWLKKDLALAIENKELFLNYQPIFNIKDKQLIGVESLVRWEHREYGLIPPTKFIPLSEEAGMIDAIGAWVLMAACKQNKAWQNQGYKKITMSVNVSIIQLENPEFVDIIRQALKASDLDPKDLQLEITESVFTGDYKLIQNKIKEISDMGIRFSIDDFGTGYSSLSQLFELEISNFKMDRLFITNVDTISSKAKIVKAIILLAESLGISLTAEGVSTKEELDFLRENKCPLGQGFLLSKPLPANRMEKLLTRGLD